MTSAKTFIVGDIHGCLDMLKRLLDKISWSPEKDSLIFLGDYIDRGKNPKGVVDYILGLSRISSRVEWLKGNHEAMFLDFLSGRDRDTFLTNGGWKTLESYGNTIITNQGYNIPPEHRSFYDSLKLYIELEDHYAVHAGFRPGLRIEEQTEEDMLWIRKSFIYSDYNFGKKVVFGHTPFHEPLIMENKIGLDTGAVYGNRLTCLELPDGVFHTVEA
ncbi:Ser/Thr phosphatase family protein [uncultured Desulfobacterium sp.]|uniref:Ser/Thr phosphatase family protein n=1 Tax=uncultured Desulfobacterium sp. TaxID=201089 RepID=A0A445MTF5_9BACT|nr:Ser/Thr phosphatase family protein [uncultured Desulfobacterium sp.]